VESERAIHAREGENEMKVYDFAGAPNPKKLRVYLAEKGLQIPMESVDILSGQNRTPEFLGKKNPLGGLPVLELDDGSCLTESLAIMEYFEELHPTPPMLGTTPLERARVREVERICELGVLSSVGTIFQNTHPFFAQRVKQSPEVADGARGRLNNALKVLDARLATQKFVAGDAPSIADCTLLAAIDFAAFAGVEIDSAYQNVHRWMKDWKQRPSASA
jgi:glutathione S-transferase